MILTLAKAIKYNEELKRGIDVHEMPKHHAAIQLGIEALKRVKTNRKGPRVLVYKELPGETEGEK